MSVDEIHAFWLIAKFQAGLEGKAVPDAWAFGEGDKADSILRLVLDGKKRATTSAKIDYDAEGVDLPKPGQLHILLDSREHPRALIECTDVRVVAFNRVDEAHATADGSADLAAWQADNREFYADDFSDDMPLVLETFTVVHPK